MPISARGVTAVVVPDKNVKLDEAGVLRALDGRLAKFKLPSACCSSMSCRAIRWGKVQKNVLRDTYAKLYAKAN